jgi:hypothetical protein
MIMNKEQEEEEEDVMYRIYFSECNHTMDANLQFLIKEAKRTPDGESYYICKDCNEHKRGYCEKTAQKGCHDNKAITISTTSPTSSIEATAAKQQQQKQQSNDV